MCLRGASEVQEQLLAKNDDSRLRAYVVWQPMLGGQETHVPDATRIVTDERASQYWDGPGSTLRSYRSVLSLAEPAWDIYMVYGPKARWQGDLPPEPAYWMHQLGERDRPRVDGPYLDAEVFAKKTNELLPKQGNMSTLVNRDDIALAIARTQ